MESQPDHTENPAGSDTGQGYPEDEQPGAGQSSGTDANPEQGNEQPSSPKSSGGRDSDPGAATGNPGAAG